MYLNTGMSLPDINGGLQRRKKFVEVYSTSQTPVVYNNQLLYFFLRKKRNFRRAELTQV